MLKRSRLIVNANHDGIPYVSVIVPVYDGERTIRKCLDSIMKLNYPKDKFEVLVIDDESTDKTVQIVKQYPVKLIMKTHGGYPSTMNVGIENAKGEIVLNVDSDTYISEDWLNKVIKEFNDSKVGVVGGFISRAPTSSFWAKLVGYDSEYRQHQAIQKSNYMDHITTSCTAFRRKLFDDIGFFDESFRLGSDEDLTHRAFKAGWKLVVKKNAICYHDFKGSFRSYVKQHHFREGWYQFKEIRKHPELIRGKKIYPAKLYVPLFLTFFLFVIPFMYITDRIFLFLLTSTLFIVYHIPESIAIIRKHREWMFLLFPVVIVIRYIAWLLGFASALADEIVSKVMGR